MKNIVVFDDYNEIDLKPADLLNEYKKLTKEDVSSLLLSGRKLKECRCPACDSKEAVFSFEKFGFKYLECKNCLTLYISPRPCEQDLDYYYNNSKARIFWRDVLSKDTVKKRKEKIIKPRIDWIVESIREYLPAAKHYADINSVQSGYIEEILTTEIFKKKTLINPFLKADNFKLLNQINVIKGALSSVNLNGEIDVISLFEIINRCADVDVLFGKIRDLLRENGLCFITAILASGFDLQILWDKADSIYPPDRMNVFTVEGLKILFERFGFECLEFSTPGILDVEIVEKVLKNNPQPELPKFVKYMFEKRGDDVKYNFQQFLQANLLSSYARVLIKKR